jgi:hypothetical protein
MFLDGLRYFLIGLLLISLQFFLIQEVNLGTWIKPMPYIFLIFILPFELNKYAVLFISFALGFALDSIGDTYGLHAASCVSLAFIKHHADRTILNIEAVQLQGNSFLTPSFKGFSLYAAYTLSLVFIHHLIYFSFDYFKFTAFFTIIAISFLSTLVTFLFMLLYLSVMRKN